MTNGFHGIFNLIETPCEMTHNEVKMGTQAQSMKSKIISQNKCCYKVCVWWETIFKNWYKLILNTNGRNQTRTNSLHPNLIHYAWTLTLGWEDGCSWIISTRLEGNSKEWKADWNIIQNYSTTCNMLFNVFANGQNTDWNIVYPSKSAGSITNHGDLLKAERKNISS